MNIKEAVQKIKKGNKYTILGFNDFGFPVVSHTTIMKAHLDEYAQYDTVLVIEHKPKRKRSLYRRYLLPGQIFVLWEGWVDIDTNDFWRTETSENGITYRISRMAFDRSYIVEKINKVTVKPLIIIE